MMPYRGILVLGFSVCTLSWTFAPAWAQLPVQNAYSRFVFTPERIQDQLPQPASARGKRRIADISKTNFKASIEMFFSPGNPKSPAFTRARFNVRETNHAWQEIDSGFQWAVFRPVERYQRISEGASAFVEFSGPLPPGTLNFDETPMPANSIIASAMEISGGIANFLSYAQFLFAPGSPKQSAPPVLEMHIAIPVEQFKLNDGEFQTQARLSYEHYHLGDRSRSIVYRKMIYGRAKVAPLTEAEASELTHLLALHEETNCEDAVEPESRKH